MPGLEVADDVTAGRRRSSRSIFVVRRPKVADTWSGSQRNGDIRLASKKLSAGPTLGNFLLRQFDQSTIKISIAAR
jgi:hypothetical protein